MKQEITLDEFTLKLYDTINTFNHSTVIHFDLTMGHDIDKEIVLTSQRVETPIKNLEEMQNAFDMIMTIFGIEFCKVDDLQKYYDFFSPHVKEILSNYCIRINSDEDILDVNPLYIRTKFLETN